jgi:hypothetical protein
MKNFRKAVVEDAWVQVFFILAVISGLLTADELFRRPPQPQIPFIKNLTPIQKPR